MQNAKLLFSYKLNTLAKLKKMLYCLYTSTSVAEAWSSMP